MRKIKNKRVVPWIITIAVVAIFLMFLYLSLRKTDIQNGINSSSSSTTAVNNDSILRPANNPFDHISLNARAAYVLDLTNDQVLFAKNENEPLPLASITKLMTALVSSTILSKTDVITVSTSSLALEGDNGLIPNESWQYGDLLDFTLIVSSNDGANAIALASAAKGLTPEVLASMSTTSLEENFVEKMNTEAANLSLWSFNFNNESGLDVNATTPGSVGSAKDVARLLQYLLKNHPELLEITKYKNFKFTSLSGVNHSVLNTDEAIGKISHLIASKTGFTLLAGGNLAVVYDPGLNHPIAIVVLGSTSSGRFTDTIKLASSTSAYIRNTI